jgi:hypothetical protein
MSVPTNTTGRAAEAAVLGQEAVMGQPIPAQHPSVVLRSQFNLVRALLAIAMVAVLALSAVVVILANDEDQVSGGAASARPIESINYGGFNPATGRPDAPAVQQQSQAAGTRFDGGPEEGTRGATSYYESPSARSSYQPAPADSVK